MVFVWKNVSICFLFSRTLKYVLGLVAYMLSEKVFYSFFNLFIH